MSKYVISGGPCSGKTTLVETLSFLGFPTMPEAAREIIKHEKIKQLINPSYKPVDPVEDVEKFQELVLEKQEFFEKQLKSIPDYSSKNIFLDRSFVDGIGYANRAKVPISDRVYNLIENSDYKKVFFLDTLKNYSTDNERKESFEIGLQIRDSILDAYKKTGLEVVFIKDTGLKNRLETIIGEVIKDKVREKIDNIHENPYINLNKL